MTNPSFNDPPFPPAEQRELARDLHNVELPPDLLTRLNAIPARGAKERPSPWPRIAAAIVIALGISLLFLWTSARAAALRQGDHLRTLTLQAVHHAPSLAATYPITDPDLLAKALRDSPDAPATRLRADVYTPAEGTTLLGGGTAFLQGKPLFFTRYQRDGKSYTLYQVSLSAFDLPRKLAHDRTTSPVAVETWPDATGSCGWLLVSSDASPLPASQLLKTAGVW